MKKSRMAAFWLFLILLLGAVFPSFGASEAPKLRVLLRRLNITDRILFKLDGTYAVKTGLGAELLLPRGAEFTMELRDGRMILFSGGAAVTLGTAVTMTRCDDGGETSGLYLNSAGLYPGDLSLTVADGKIQPVLRIDLEDYLLGVVPYEMNDSFPLEALKAQAICARTYALKRLGRDGDWDVVDTTNDQVFRGVSASNANCARAISETSGLVIARDGALINGYYSASNGGQTELPSHVWGSDSEDGAYAVQDDPWDAGNPDSLTRSGVLPKDGSGLYRWMTRLLREAVFADPRWASEGFLTDEEGFQVTRIRSVLLKTPKFPSPSRLLTEMEMELDASGVRSAGGELEAAGTFTITLKLFPDVLNALGIQVTGNGNEIVSVTEEEQAFRVTAGRYGHGVGLSQRGAQWMASDGKKTFDQIISFYFPGAQIMHYTGVASPLPAVPEYLTVTPEETEPDTPSSSGRALLPVTEENLPEGAYIASVEGISDDSSLNLRAQPSPISSVVTRLYKHQHLIVIDELDVPGWAHVRTDEIEGYVMSSYIEKVGSESD